MRLTESWARRGVGAPADRHLVMLLHGYGSDERELLHRVGPGLEGVCDVVALRGPLRAAGGWGWASLPADASAGAAATSAVAEAAIQPLLSWLRHQGATQHTAKWLPRHSTLTGAVYPTGHDLTDDMVQDATRFIASKF